MKKKKMVVGICGAVCIALLGVGALLLSGNKKEDSGEGESSKKLQLVEVEKIKTEQILAELKMSKYSNLMFENLPCYIDMSEGLYKIKIEKDTSFEDKTYLENLQTIDKVINDFYGEDFDKSYIEADFYPGNDTVITKAYTELEEVCKDTNYNEVYDTGFIYGDDGKHMVQMTEALSNVWLCRQGFASRLADSVNNRYIYSSCVRTTEDMNVNLKDKTVKLSEMEAKVLEYMENDFPLPYGDNIQYGIAEARIIEEEGLDYNGIRFVLRRIYKSIPFEYGSEGARGEYIDEYDHDCGTLIYAESDKVDTLAMFRYVNSSAIELEQIKKVISLDTALGLLSKRIGENSVYDVHNVEMVYRAIYTLDEKYAEEIYTPRWKVATINQNDNKYTIFYIDAVSGEITERFEYYYE